MHSCVQCPHSWGHASWRGEKTRSHECVRHDCGREVISALALRWLLRVSPRLRVECTASRSTYSREDTKRKWKDRQSGWQCTPRRWLARVVDLAALCESLTHEQLREAFEELVGGRCSGSSHNVGSTIRYPRGSRHRKSRHVCPGCARGYTDVESVHRWLILLCRLNPRLLRIIIRHR
jgi:hypothetical protein